MRNYHKKEDKEFRRVFEDKLEIKSDYVLKSLNKGWDSVYPELKKQRLEAIKNNRNDLKASDLFAIHAIMTLLRRAKADKKNKPASNDLDFRIYNEYQQTNIMDKNLSNKVLRSTTVLSQVANYKKRVSRFSSPYKSRQTMITSEKSPNSAPMYQKKATQPSKFVEKANNLTPNPIIHLRKTSTFDHKSPLLEDKRNRIREKSVYITTKVMVAKMNEEKERNRLKSVLEIDEEDKLFWYSYDENFRQYPNKVKEDIQTMGSIKEKTVEKINIDNFAEKIINDTNSNSEKELEKSSLTDENSSYTEESEKNKKILNVKNEEKREKILKKDVKHEKNLKNIENSEKIPQNVEKIVENSENKPVEPIKVKIMPLKLLKSKGKHL